MKIGSVSLWLGDNPTDPSSLCINVNACEVFIHGTIAELRAFQADVTAKIDEKVAEGKGE